MSNFFLFITIHHALVYVDSDGFVPVYIQN